MKYSQATWAFILAPFTLHVLFLCMFITVLGGHNPECSVLYYWNQILNCCMTLSSFCCCKNRPVIHSQINVIESYFWGKQMQLSQHWQFLKSIFRFLIIHITLSLLGQWSWSGLCKRNYVSCCSYENSWWIQRSTYDSPLKVAIVWQGLMKLMTYYQMITKTWTRLTPIK